ncbi:gliding motility lipoprotein GldK [Bacteroidia bacterium]|nr:gliding motility lipoprotein GldK [Bacteroidia bacterium]
MVFSSCGHNSGYGELTGVMGRNQKSLPLPYGMVYVPGGYFTMGSGGEDPAYSMNYTPKSVSITSFFMDDTEITNNEYRQFVQWVIDSITYKMLGEQFPEYLNEPAEDDEEGLATINYKKKIKYTKEEREALNDLYYPVEERFYHKKEIDKRKLNYEYQWIDYVAIAKKEWDKPSSGTTDGIKYGSFVNRPSYFTSRAPYIKKEVVNVYPDEFCWLVDFAYSYNDPFVRNYFVSPAYDNYPIVGISWHQARAFSAWRTNLYNAELEKRGYPRSEDFRLPTEAEWEYAARGGLDLNPYPWGGPYASNINGCFLGNFKPQRGKYNMDGGVRPMIVGHYAPNDYGLYDMMGNVAEWCEDAYSESYDALHDFDPVFTYDAKPNDAPVMKRKVIRGGSFKDFAELTKVYARTYEYQDTCKSYVGFRNVMTAMGREGMTPEAKPTSNVYR